MKKKTKVIILVAILILVIGSVTAGVFLMHSNDGSEEGKLAANQSYIYGQISTIAGNDMNLALAEPVTVERSSLKGGAGMNGGSSNGGSGTFTRPNRGNREDASSGESGMTKQSYTTTASNSSQSGGQQMPGAVPEGEMPGAPPEGELPGGNVPNENSSNQDSANNSASGDKQDSSSDSKTDSSDSSGESTMITTYSLTGESAEYMIPVGTSVTTQLGAVTTFSRLAAGDYVKMLVEKDTDGNQVILQIWIVG